MQEFVALKAWFSTSVSKQEKELWEESGGLISENPDEANYLFSDDASAQDTINLFQNFKGGKGVVLFTSSWIRDTLQRSSNVAIENYILFPKHVAEEIELWKNQNEYEKKCNESKNQRQRAWDEFKEEMEDAEKNTNESDNSQENENIEELKRDSTIERSASNTGRNTRSRRNAKSVSNDKVKKQQSRTLTTDGTSKAGDDDDDEISDGSRASTVASTPTRSKKTARKSRSRRHQTDGNIGKRYSLRNSRKKVGSNNTAVDVDSSINQCKKQTGLNSPTSHECKEKTKTDNVDFEKSEIIQTDTITCSDASQSEGETKKSRVKPTFTNPTHDETSGNARTGARPQRKSAAKAVRKMTHKSDTESEADTIMVENTKPQERRRIQATPMDEGCTSKRRRRALLPTSPDVFAEEEKLDGKHNGDDDKNNVDATRKHLSPSEIQDTLGKRREQANEEVSASPQLSKLPTTLKSPTGITTSKVIPVVSSPLPTMEQHKAMLIHKKVGASSTDFVYGSFAGFPHIDELYLEEIDLQDFIVNKNGCQVKLKS